ncbi:TonB-dependent receptor domain-containing protein [Limnohabitans sp.]|uniref:TonB-dependent receptor domain-containing protein n=1 Tax=Limnohabitans sp. TaxID=1907725 RepID=UPI00286F1C94|nr:TonB-dependent receptor [Limnohabitans sp.]
MKKTQNKINPKTIAVAASLAALQIGSAYAQTLNLDEVVVTASPTGRTKMKSSDSVTSVGEEAIMRSGATSAAEILRSVPGIRAESSGGEGNANITVRGAPVSAGGSRYVQMQEDGLPILLFGDIAFGTPDQFMRTDFTTDRVEVVRGGSASTLASNAPGAIINFVSKNGRDVGNAVGFTTGLGSRLNRYDFNFGSAINSDTYFNIGGFTRQGEGGPYKTGFNSQDGGQLKASITKEFDKGSYVRLNFKNLDDKTPTILPVPTRLSNGKIQTLPGVDPRTAFFINPNMTRDTTIDRNGGQVTTNPADGLHVTSRSIGLEAKFNLDGGWTVEERMRKSANGGRFVGMFPADNGGGASSFTGTMFNTSLDNMDNMFNDLKASKAFDMNGGKSVFTGGLFTGSQNLAQTWFWNQYTVGTNGSWSAPTSSGWNTWGGCCSRTYDVKYNVTAPYAALSWEKDKLTVEGSVRHNEMSATGQTFKGTTPTNPTALSSATWDGGSADTVNYKQSKMSYSGGVNYALTKDTAIYGRISDGYNFAADRLMYGTAGALNGSKPVSFNRLQQQELGVKHREGNLSLFGTFFMAKTDESNYEATTQKFTTNGYKAQGFELEAGYRSGAFRLNAGATITDAKIKNSLTAAEIGKKPRRQADLVYALSPSYRTGDLEYGAAFIGSTKSYGDDANTITMDGYMVTNLFANYRINKQASAIVSVNNAFNKLAFTEVEGDGHAARALAGRSAKATLKYEF